MSSATPPARAGTPPRVTASRPGWRGSTRPSPPTTCSCASQGPSSSSASSWSCPPRRWSRWTRRASAYTIFLRQAGFAAVGILALAARGEAPRDGLEAPRAARSSSSASCSSCSCYPDRRGGQRQPQLARLGRLQLQPSEVVKVGLVLAGGLVLAAQAQGLHSFSHVARALPRADRRREHRRSSLLGHDLGTVSSWAPSSPGVLFAAGVPLRLFAIVGLPLRRRWPSPSWCTSPNRLAGFDVWLGRDTDPFGAARPAAARPLCPGRRRLVGRRPRRQPREVGVALRAAQRLHLRHHRRGARPAGHAGGPRCSSPRWRSPATASCRAPTTSSSGSRRRGVMAWIVVQAIVNIGAVIGLLPVIGVPLPLVSSGGLLARHDDARAGDAPLVRAAASPAAPRRCPPGPRRAALAGRPSRAAPRAKVRIDDRRPPSSVLLAGGGTRRPRLAPARARRLPAPARPRRTRHRPRHRDRASRPGSCPPAATTCARAQGAAARAAPPATCCACRRNLSAAVAAAGAAIDETGAEVVVGFGGYVSTPAYLAARRRGCRSSCTSRTPAPASPTGSARAAPATWQRRSPGTAAAAGATVIGHAAAPRDRDRSTARRGATEAPARTSGSTRSGRRCSSPVARSGAQRLNDAFAAAARRRSPSAGVQVLHVTGRGQGVRAGLRGPGAPYVVAAVLPTAWTSRMPPPTSSSPAPAPTRSAS